MLQLVRRSNVALVAIADSRAALAELQLTNREARTKSAALLAQAAQLVRAQSHLRRAEKALRAARDSLGALPEAHYGKTRDQRDPLWRCVHPDCGSLEWAHRRRTHMFVFHDADVPEDQIENHFEPAPQPPEEKPEREEKFP